MKIKFILLLAISFPTLLWAQITINVVQPPAGMVTKDQLWNLVLTNNSNTGSQITILLNLKDAVTGQLVLSAGTRNILLNKGIKVLTIQDVQPVQYTSGAGNATANFLPPGSYIACYTVSNYNHELLQTLATECVRVNITPLSPPLLNTPANRSTIQTQAPQLTWIPPAPLDMFDNLNYELSVAEILDGQSPAEAIRYNTPVYSAAHLKAPYENYSSTFSALKAGKTYRPQIAAGTIALDGERELSYSEHDHVRIALEENAFRTVNVAAVMDYAARHGLMRQAGSVIKKRQVS